MAVASTSDLVTDAFLREILQESAAAREAFLALIRPSADHDIEAREEDDDEETTKSRALAASRARKRLQQALAALRGRNRRLARLVRATKGQTAGSRGEVDTLHLSLQNLYYESRHLVGEIAACEAFPHTYLALPMPSEADFLAEHPELAGAGEAALMAARIDREHRDRAALERERQGLVARRAALMRENAQRKEELGRLDADLERFIDAAKPIQKTFEKEW